MIQCSQDLSSYLWNRRSPTLKVPEIATSVPSATRLKIKDIAYYCSENQKQYGHLTHEAEVMPEY